MHVIFEGYHFYIVWRRWKSPRLPSSQRFTIVNPDDKVHGSNMGPTWVLRPHVGPMNLAIREDVMPDYRSRILVTIFQTWTKMVEILQLTFSDAFSWINITMLWFRFEFVPKDTFDNKPVMVQIMNPWYRTNYVVHWHKYMPPGASFTSMV